MFREIANALAGRRKKYSETLQGLVGLESLLNNFSEATFTIDYFDLKESYKREDYNFQSTINFLNSKIIEKYLWQISTVHEIYSGDKIDRHYIDFEGFYHFDIYRIKPTLRRAITIIFDIKNE